MILKGTILDLSLLLIRGKRKYSIYNYKMIGFWMNVGLVVDMTQSNSETKKGYLLIIIALNFKDKIC